MKEYTTDQLRNIVLLGHGSSGKTSLAEAMLFTSGAVNRQGRIEDGTTVADFDEEEIRRRISLSLALVPVEWDGCKLNVLDTPGYTDFVGEVISAVLVADLALVLVDPVGGVEVGTELVWSYADQQGLPRMVVINKMNRENANFNRTLQSLRDAFGRNFVPLHLPIGSQGDLAGVVDLVKMQALMGPEGKVEEIPADLAAQAEEARVQVVEAAAEGEDELIMKYLEGETLTEEEIARGLRTAILSGAVVPVLVTAATGNLGTRALLDALVTYAPSPADRGPVQAEGLAGEEEIEPNELAPLAALVFKTAADPYVGKLTYFRVYGGVLESDTRVWNSRAETEERLGTLYVMRGKEQLPVRRLRPGDIGAVAKLSVTVTGDTLCDRGHPVHLPGPVFPHPLFAVSVHPKSKADQAKMGPTLTRICEEDPTLRWRQEPSTRETILEGMGEAHVDIAVRRMANRFGVGVETAIPKVPYRETITRVNADQYRHKKQTGGAGQFAEVHMRLEPLSRGEGFEYDWEVFGGAISSSFRPSIEKGIRQVLEQGVLAGYPVVDLKAVVYDGKEHPVDSKDIAFQIAGREAFKKVMLGAGPVLLEPIYKVTITVPEEYTGDVMGDLNTKRARVQGMDQKGGKSIITALAPLAEMQRYATDLRSLTQGRGLFSMEFDHYEEVPAHLAQQIIEAAKRERGSEK
ncbi:MAG TPA: elongation factor G [Anaerolineales bacterium]|nr:elongation factor G [Anaerolineae bacterium]HIQ00818.1 elongation factor G [Anaerolineales bacterium]